MKESFIFFASFDEALRELPDKSRLKVYDAVCDYALRGIEADFNGIEKAIFTLIKAQIDRRNQRVENGKKGGRKKQDNLNHTLSILEPHLNQSSSEVKPHLTKKEKVSPMREEAPIKESSKENIPQEESITLERDKIQKSKKENYINNNYQSVPTHEEIMRDYGISDGVIATMQDFLRHCYLNGVVVSNAKLEDILFRLVERYGQDAMGMNECINTAIRGGYVDIR